MRLPMVPPKTALAHVGVVYGDAIAAAQAAATYCAIMIVPPHMVADLPPGPFVLPYGHAWMVRDYMPYFLAVRGVCDLPVGIPKVPPEAVVANPSATSAWASVFATAGCRFADELFGTPVSYGADANDPALVDWPWQTLDWWKRVPTRPRLFNGLTYPLGMDAFAACDGAMVEQFAQGASWDADVNTLNTVFAAQQAYPGKTILLVSSAFNDEQKARREYVRSCALLAANRRTFFSWSDSVIYNVAPADDTALFKKLGAPSEYFTDLAAARWADGLYRRHFYGGTVIVDPAARTGRIEWR